MATSMLQPNWVDIFGLFIYLTMLFILGITAWGGYKQYKESKYKERILKDFEIRRDFILQPGLYEIQGKIEHESDDLEEILRNLVNTENPYDPNLLNDNQKKLHQQLDCYISYLEAVGSLRYRGWLEKKDYPGFWNYYFRRLSEWEILWKYISTPDYEWNDATRWAQEIHDEYEEKAK